LIGTGFANAIFGGAGSDSLNGGGGNDVLNGGTGFDVLNGGEGVDTASYIDAVSAVQVQLGGTGLASTTTTGDQGDWLISIENVWGSSHSDYIGGDQFNNQISGAGGNDTMLGYAGADTFSGRAGNDILNGGAGADRLDGGEGADTASYANSISGVSISLSATSQLGGDAIGDLLTGIENLEGSSYGDTLRGDGAYNTLIGGYGADRLFGEGGMDALVGGRGIDTLSAGVGRDTFVIAKTDIGTGVDIGTDFERGFDHIDLRSFGFRDLPGTDDVGVGPTDGTVWNYGHLAGYQLVFDPSDHALYSVVVSDDTFGEYRVSSRTGLITLTGVSTLTGDDLILS